MSWHHAVNPVQYVHPSGTVQWEARTSLGSLGLYKYQPQGNFRIMNTFLRIQALYKTTQYQWVSDFQCFECNMSLRNARNMQCWSITSQKTWILSNNAVRNPNLANIFFTTTAYTLVFWFTYLYHQWNEPALTELHYSMHWSNTTQQTL